MTDQSDDSTLGLQETSVDPEGKANMQAMNFWDRIVDDLEATAAEYKKKGWETLQLHPGDITILSGETPADEQSEQFGIDVLVPDDEFEEVEALFDRGISFDAYEVFRGKTSRMVFLVVAMEDTDKKTALLYPAYYQVGDPDTIGLFERARNEMCMYSYVRRLDCQQIEFQYEDPCLFEPPKDESAE